MTIQLAQLIQFDRNAPILMENSEHVGVFQTAGIPLKQTIGPSDYYAWRDAIAAPARHAAYVVSIGDDDVAKAVKAHPEGLDEPMSILCTTNASSGAQTCVRFYQSSLWKKKVATP